MRLRGYKNDCQSKNLEPDCNRYCHRHILGNAIHDLRIGGFQTEQRMDFSALVFLRYIRHHRRYRDIRLRLYPGEEEITQHFRTTAANKTARPYIRNLLR